MDMIDRPARSPTQRQRGSFLLEAMVAVLIVAFGILGLVGLQARMIQSVDDSEFRGEAAQLANDVLGRMWTSDQTALVANFDRAGAGTGYSDFKTLVTARLPGAAAIANNPDVTITPRFGDPLKGYDVTIVVQWLAPGELTAGPPPTPHNYTTTAVVRLN